MNSTSKQPGRSAPDEMLRAALSEVTRSNESLRAQISQLQQQNAKLSRSIEAAQRVSQAERESRRAALNLMEDAVEARRRQQEDNERRRKAEAELHESYRRKDEFLAVLAHELRNPLAPIRSGLHVLRRGGADPTEAACVLEMMARQTSHLVRLVDDLLEVSRITCGKIELRKERVDAAGPVRSAIESARPALEAAGHTLHVTFPSEALYLDGDPVRLAQAISNLLNNAVKYTPAGGDISVALTRDQDHALVTVRDSGIGISAEVLPHIFEMFVQGDSRNGALGGLGVGLTLVQNLVEMHGGTVRGASEGPGKGSQFIIRLPLANAPAPAAPGPAAPGRAPCSPIFLAEHRILVVDDNRDSAVSMGMLLSLQGAKVKTVNDGPAALALLSEYRPTTILLDLGMPDMDGYEVARRVRAASEGRAVVLIALTGWGQEADRQRSREAGFDHHLVKPVELDALMNVLQPCAL